jgi:hypothetical protein
LPPNPARRKFWRSSTGNNKPLDAGESNYDPKIGIEIGIEIEIDQKTEFITKIGSLDTDSIKIRIAALTSSPLTILAINGLRIDSLSPTPICHHVAPKE